MIRSMTAFTRQESPTEWGVLSCEMRTVNHRFVDISLRLSQELRVLESGIRERVRARIKRGKVEGSLRFEAVVKAGTEPALNRDLINLLIKANNEIEGMLENPGRTCALEILQWPGVMKVVEADLDQVRDEAVKLFASCLDELCQDRLREGAAIKGFIEQRSDSLMDEVVQVRKRLPVILESQRSKLHARLEELKADLDTARLEQELAYLAQKIDIDEELDRIGIHVDEVRRVLTQDEPVGRRLDFLMQELNREANTLGSKSVDIATTRAAVEMKVLVEQMREQVQNVE